MEKHLHIICLNVPYPADFGGVFDLFYKLPALHKEGVKINLHCFEYGRGLQPELEKYCEKVFYYKRKTGLPGFSINLPYIVSSRIDQRLLDRLLADDHPILMEGVHCTYLLNDDRFKNRKLFVRLHNVEHIYYHHLYKTTASISKKIYSLIESRKLKAYEKSIANKATFIAVSNKDVDDYKMLGCKKVSFLPLFLPAWQVDGQPGKGTFCLYHGNLEISENEQAVQWLLKNIFNDLKLPLVIAGKNPGKHLQKLTEGNDNICLIANPTEDEMQDIIRKAHINIIPSLNATGIKLKLVNALYNGRHVAGNVAMAIGTGLEPLCYIENDTTKLKALLQQLYNEPFTEEDILKRKAVLDAMFNNEATARALIQLIWD